MGSFRTAGYSGSSQSGLSIFRRHLPIGQARTRNQTRIPPVTERAWPFRGLVFPMLTQVRNIDNPLLQKTEISGGPEGAHLSFPPCLSASVVQRFCLWLRPRRAAFQDFDFGLL